MQLFSVHKGIFCIDKVGFLRLSHISRESKEVLTQISPLIYSIQYLLVDKLDKGQLAELLAILDSFYTTFTNDHMEVEVRGDGEPWKWRVLPHVEVDLPEGLI